MSNFTEILRAKETLGIGNAISLKALREKYLILAKRFHPDVAGNEDATLAEITHAYQLLASYLENASISLDDEDVRKNDPHAYHAYRFHDWLGGKS